jgi:mono/diheme cytochrome c family protein
VVAGVCFALSGAALMAQAPPAKEDTPAFVGNKTSKTFHRPTCASVKRIAAKSRVDLTSLEDAKEKGFRACATCKPAGDEAADDMPAAKGKPSAKGAGKASTAKGAMKKGEPDPPAAAKPADENGLKFSRDVAPIIVGNCIGCHNPTQKRGKFDLTTFQKLIGGSAKGKVIVPGKPDESVLLLRVKGEENPKMPPGQRNLSAEAIAKIEQWIKAGAILDAGVEPTVELAKVAPTPEMLRRNALLKLSNEERDKQALDVALERWKKASSKTTPELTPDKHFLLFSNLPKDRAKQILKAMEVQYTRVGQLLGPAAASTLGGPEKISLYVFNDRNSYIEFIRANENREVDDEVEAHGNLAVETPYLAALDPLGGGEDPHAGSASKKSAGRSKRDEEPTGPTRSLVGLLAEQLGVGVASQSGKPPRWLALGLGAFLGSAVEPRSPYYRKLRNEVSEAYQQGWSPKVQEALGGEGEPLRIRAIGFSMMEWLNGAARQAFAPFVREMLEGGEKLDPTVQGIFGGATRDQFLSEWGGWVVSHYGRGR